MTLVTAIGWVLIIAALFFGILIVSHTIIHDVAEERRKTSVLGIKELDHYMDKLCESIKDLAKDIVESFGEKPASSKTKKCEVKAKKVSAKDENWEEIPEDLKY